MSVRGKQLADTEGLRLRSTVSYDTADEDRNGNYDPHLEVAARRLWDLCEKYWASSYQGKSSVITEMWSPMEDFCNASQCPYIYDVVRGCIWELVQGFDDTEDDRALTMEEWWVLVRDTVRKYRTEAESHGLINMQRRPTVGSHGRG